MGWGRLMKYFCDQIKRGWLWLWGSHPQGIGTLLIGVAAIWALIDGADLLKQVLKIQDQAKQIETAVGELKSQSQQIASAIDLLGSQLKELKASQAVDSSPALKSANPTKEQIKEAIRNFPANPSTKRSTIYLPTDKIDETVELIYKEKNPAARAAVLRNSLEYKSSGFLTNENGSRLTTEDGMGIDLENKAPPKKVGKMNLGKLSVSDLIAILSLLVAALSLVINIVPLWRDRARIDFSLYLADLGAFHQGKFIKQDDYYAFRVVNSGRRPITITHVGGVTSEVNFFHYWIWRLTGLSVPRMFLINDPGLTTLLKDTNGNDRTLNEGEYSFGSVKIDLTISKKSGGMTARQFHVVDSVGRYNRLSRSAHLKLNKAVKDLLNPK
ncbi:MAG: hypothetical protein ACXVB1_05565 [Pseudobdellovibrionaceae bacterium]